MAFRGDMQVVVSDMTAVSMLFDKIIAASLQAPANIADTGYIVDSTMNDFVHPKSVALTSKDLHSNRLQPMSKNRDLAQPKVRYHGWNR